jgi:hypothetical protein
LVATAQALLEGVATVNRAVAIAGVGRNTFYECFDDFEHAQRAARTEASKRMRQALDSVARGKQWAEELSLVWVATVLEEPLLALAALQPRADRSLSELGSVFGDALARGASEERNALDASARFGLALAAASAEACARELVLAAAARASGRRQATQGLLSSATPAVESAEAARVLATTIQAAMPRELGDKI